MFIGHFAVGMALKRAAPTTSLGWLIAAPQLLDLLWPLFLLAGWERVRIDPGNTPMTPLAFDSYPISHSLVMSCVWAGALAVIYYSRAHLGKASLWIAAAVVSHWVLDWVTHRPDMPIAPGLSMKVGLGLWYSVPATVIVESLMFAAGIWVYATTTRARDGVGRWSCLAFVTVLAAIYAANLIGPPPPSVKAIAVAALGLWIFPLWAAWLDRHRELLAIADNRDLEAERHAARR